MISAKELSKAPLIYPKETEIHELLDKEFKVIILQSLKSYKKAQIDN